jgi:hypothetical protein
MKYFTIAELCKSETADRLGIDNRCKNDFKRWESRFPVF